MPIRLTMKTPDCVEMALAGIDHLPEEQQEKIRKAIKKFVKYDEYVTIEIDEETETAKVIPVQ